MSGGEKKKNAQTEFPPEIQPQTLPECPYTTIPPQCPTEPPEVCECICVCKPKIVYACDYCSNNTSHITTTESPTTTEKVSVGTTGSHSGMYRIVIYLEIIFIKSVSSSNGIDHRCLSLLIFS